MTEPAPDPDPTGPYPFGATVEQVRVKVADIAEGVRPAGAPFRPGIADGIIGGWLNEGGADVRVAIRGYDRLATQHATPDDNTTPVVRPGQDQLVDDILTVARALTVTYAAAQLASVTFPERTSRGQLGPLLMAQYTDGLTRLTGNVRDELTRLAELEPVDVTAGEGDESGGLVAAPRPFLASPGYPGFATGVLPWNAWPPDPSGAAGRF